jgi:sulfur carrier protein ThiS
MRVKLEYAAIMDVPGIRNRDTVEVREDATVRDLLEHLKISPEHQQYVVPVINDRAAKLVSRLRPNDHVFLSMPIGGG